MKARLLGAGALILLLAAGPARADVDVGIFFSGAAIHGDGFSLYIGGGPYYYGAPYGYRTIRPFYTRHYYRYDYYPRPYYRYYDRSYKKFGHHPHRHHPHRHHKYRHDFRRGHSRDGHRGSRYRHDRGGHRH